MTGMETFRTDVELENPARPGERRFVSAVLVDTGSELSWIPARTSSNHWVSFVASSGGSVRRTELRSNDGRVRRTRLVARVGR